MTGFLLDTNVVSEMTRSRPSPLVVAFLDRTSELWLASLVRYMNWSSGCV